MRGGGACRDRAGFGIAQPLRQGPDDSVFINTSSDMRTLQLQKTSREAELKTLVLEMLEGLKSLAIEYR